MSKDAKDRRGCRIMPEDFLGPEKDSFPLGRNDLLPL